MVLAVVRGALTPISSQNTNHQAVVSKHLNKGLNMISVDLNLGLRNRTGTSSIFKTCLGMKHVRLNVHLNSLEMFIASEPFSDTLLATTNNNKQELSPETIEFLFVVIVDNSRVKQPQCLEGADYPRLGL